jgi:hypothetical protein
MEAGMEEEEMERGMRKWRGVGVGGEGDRERERERERWQKDVEK